MKAIRTAVVVIGVGAAILSGVGALGVGIGIAASTLTAVSTIAGVASTLLTMTAKKPEAGINGSITEYKLDPNGGIPYMMGRTFYAGSGVKRETWGKDNEYQGFTSVYSYGPIAGIDAFLVDRTTPISFSGGAAVGSLNGFMWLSAQVGLQPSPFLAPPISGYPGWTATDRLSGLAASHWILKFDTKGKKYTGGVPAPGVIGRGVLVYDPRQDSTFPGGSGPCRANNESTYVYSDRPALHGLTYALGRYQNGKRRMGMGFRPDQIDVAAFAQAANIEDANNWRIGGMLYSTDPKWNRLKQIGQAGGWEPVQTGGRLTLIQSAPRVSVATIDADQMVGQGTVVGTQSRRSRINGMVPRFPAEEFGWQIVPADVVRVPEYSALDGGDRTEEFDLEFVPYLKQATELTSYELVNRREIGPIELNLRLRWIGLEPGDCVTLNIPELNLNGQKCIVLSRTLNGDGRSVQLSLRSETDGKHDYALGKPGAVPPIPSLTAPDSSLVAAPIAGAWLLQAIQLEQGSAGGYPVLRFTGVVDNPNAEAIIFDYRESGTTEWIGASIHSVFATTVDIATLKPGGIYEGGVRYVVRGVGGERRILGPVSLGNLNTSPVNWDDVLDPNGTKPDDGATVGAPPGTNVGDRPVVNLLAEVDKTLADIEALNQRLEAGGDLKQYADAAEAAAELSKEARDAAQAAAAAAAVKATEAGSSAANAEGKAQIATDKAAQAATYSQTAADRAADASGYASAASSASTSAGAASTAAGNSAAAAEASRQAAAAANGSASGYATAAQSSAVAADASRATSETAAGNAATYRDQALSSAQSSSSSLALATAEAAAAQRSAEVAARISTPLTNLGASFSNWPDGQDLPSYWRNWNYGDHQKITGIAGAYAFRQYCPPNSFRGLEAEDQVDPGLTGLGGGKLVVDADVTLEGGTFNGAGMLVYALDANFNLIAQYTMSFYHDKSDVSGNQANLGGVEGKRYRFTKLMDIAPCTHVKIYLMTGWQGGFAGMSVTEKRLTWHRCGIRPATQPEINAGQADLSGIEARVSTTESAIATLEGYAAARWQVQAVAGDGRAQLTVYADTNGGGGVDIVGDTTFRGRLAVGLGKTGKRIQITDELIEGFYSNGGRSFRIS